MQPHEEATQRPAANMTSFCSQNKGMVTLFTITAVAIFTSTTTAATTTTTTTNTRSLCIVCTVNIFKGFSSKDFDHDKFTSFFAPFLVAF